MPILEYVRGGSDRKAQFPGNPELSGWLMKNRLPITTNLDVDRLRNQLKIEKSILRPLGGNIVQRLWAGDVDERLWSSERSVERGFVAPIYEVFGQRVTTYGPSGVTLPRQIASWINDAEPKVTCQFPLALSMILMDQAHISYLVSLGRGASHPYLHIGDGKKSYKIDFGEGEGRVMGEDVSTWKRHVSREGSVGLNSILGTMRFLDYNTAMISVIGMIREAKHRGTDQMRLMGTANDLFENMNQEFSANPGELERYEALVWDARWKDLQKDPNLSL